MLILTMESTPALVNITSMETVPHTSFDIDSDTSISFRLGKYVHSALLYTLNGKSDIF